MIHQVGPYQFEIPDDARLGPDVLKTFTKKNYYFKCIEPGPQETWIDVGASLGAVTVPLRGMVGRVIAVEPDPTVAQLLRTNLKLNGCEDVDVIEAAVVAEDDPRTKVTFWVNTKGYLLSNSLVQKRNREAITVPAMRMRELFETYAPDGVKVCCQGGEAEILRGTDWNSVKKLVAQYDFNGRSDFSHETYDPMLAELRRQFPHVVDTEPNHTIWHANISCWR